MQERTYKLGWFEKVWRGRRAITVTDESASFKRPVWGWPPYIPSPREHVVPLQDVVSVKLRFVRQGLGPLLFVAGCFTLMLAADRELFFGPPGLLRYSSVLLVVVLQSMLYKRWVKGSLQAELMLRGSTKPKTVTVHDISPAAVQGLRDLAARAWCNSTVYGFDREDEPGWMGRVVRRVGCALDLRARGH